ncbi:MAG: inner membrane CreD family protein, partial [Pseudomonadota bacterium]
MTDNTDHGTAYGPAAQQHTATGKFMTFLASPAVKFILIGVLSFLLLVPSIFVWVLVEERADRAKDVAREIARSWGGTQEINGPYLVIPFTETYTTGLGEEVETKTVRRTAVLFPERLTVGADITVEERQKSIYSLPVYNAQLDLAGTFAAPPADMFDPRHGGTIDVAADRAVLVVGILDVRALRSEVALGLSGTGAVPFEPGLGPLTADADRDPRRSSGPSGINAAVSPQAWRNGFSFDVSLQL